MAPNGWTGMVRLHDCGLARLQCRPKVSTPSSSGSSRVQGVWSATGSGWQHLEACAAAGCCPSREMVGDLSGTRIERSRRQTEYLEPEHRSVFLQFYGRARSDPAGAFQLLPEPPVATFLCAEPVSSNTNRSVQSFEQQSKQ